MKYTILALSMLLTSTVALASPKINLLENKNLYCKSIAGAHFLLHDINSDKPKYNTASYPKVKLNVISILEKEIEFEIPSKDKHESIKFFKTRKNEEGVITLIGIHTTNMGDENLIECTEV